MSLTI